MTDTDSARDAVLGDAVSRMAQRVDEEIMRRCRYGTRVLAPYRREGVDGSELRYDLPYYDALFEYNFEMDDSAAGCVRPAWLARFGFKDKVVCVGWDGRVEVEPVETDEERRARKTLLLAMECAEAEFKSREKEPR